MPGPLTPICNVQKRRNGAKGNCEISTLVKCFLQLPQTICVRIQEALRWALESQRPHSSVQG
jgi:hypothetical protein